MEEEMAEEAKGSSRRSVIRLAAAVPATCLAGYAAGSDTIRLGLIGCGGRGTDAALEAMEADRGVNLVAVGDVLLDRAQEKRSLFKTRRPEQAVLGLNDCFGGFDSYKRVIERSDVVIIANAAKFHPMYLMAAVEAGKHVFVEKPHAIDPAGIQVVKAACALAKQKNLCVVSGLHSRYDAAYREIVQRLYDGAIGRITHIEENFLRAPYVLYPRKPGLTEVLWQASNQYHFHWLSGDDVTQSLVHNVDRASWVLKGAEPVKCRGMGGRSTLRGEQYGNVFDHHSVVYEFPADVRVYAYCRTIPNCANDYSSVVYGTKGSCSVMGMWIRGENPWKYTGPKQRAHFNEHVELYKALREGRRINNGDYMARSTLIAIMGQISCYSGQEVTWQQAVNSNYSFLPRPEDVRADMESPTKPDAEGVYPPAFTPGVSKLL
jgi:myo-inositol 2-dehydrogenase / D-chiro-inositol 1-dehydrogenase